MLGPYIRCVLGLLPNRLTWKFHVKSASLELKINPPASGKVRYWHDPLPEPHPYWYNILRVAGKYKGGAIYETFSCAPLSVAALPVIRQPRVKSNLGTIPSANPTPIGIIF